MGLDMAAIEVVVRNWIMEATSLSGPKVIFDKPNAPKPKEPYCTIDPNTAVARLGIRDEERLSDDNPGVIEFVGNRRITMSINFYGENANTLANNAMNKLQSYGVAELFRVANVSPEDLGGVRDLTFLEDTEYTQRAQLDVALLATSSFTEDVGYIETVGLTFILPE